MAAPRYEEQLSAPRSWWAMAGGIGVVCALSLVPLGTPAALGALVLGTVLASIVVSVYGAVRVRVLGDSLVAGQARLPLWALGEPEPLDQEQALAWRTHRADPRAFLLLRGYVRTAVRVPVTDPEDPTPYLYLSTRRPEALSKALVQASRESAQPREPR